VPADPIYAFLHVPKTGGTTINAHLRHRLGWDEEFVHLGGWGDRYRTAAGRRSPDRWSPEERARIRVCAGHQVGGAAEHLAGPDRSIRYFTILRDPADRIVSTYNFRMATEDRVDFWEWYSGYRPNAASRWLRRRLEAPPSTAALLEALRRFWFIGTTEHLDVDLPNLFSAMGVPGAWTKRRVAGAAPDLDNLDHPDAGRVIPRLITVDDEIRERLHADNRRDLRLYHFALRRRARMRWDR